MLALAVAGTYSYAAWVDRWQSDLMNALDEAICFYSVLISFGFDAKDVYLGFESGRVHIVLFTQEKRFDIGCGPMDMNVPPDELLKAWAARVLWWNDPNTTPDARAAIQSKSYAQHHHTALVDSLIRLGFKIPNATQLTRETPPPPAVITPKPAPKPTEPVAPLSFPMPAPKGGLN